MHLPGVEPASRAAFERLLARRDPGVVGVVLSGSAARGMATAHSDVDVYVVWSAREGRETERSPEIDEIPVDLAELETIAPFGTEDWYSRWSFAWARVLRDDTGGRVAAAVRRQATLDAAEQRAVLLDADRLDGFVNFAYRALKSARDGRPLEQRLDAAESVAWLLDSVFALHGRVRPYNKYLAWELREHPLPDPAWAPDRLLPLVERLLAGEAAACWEALDAVAAGCRRWDAEHGGTSLTDLLAGWDDELGRLRGAGAPG